MIHYTKEDSEKLFEYNSMYEHLVLVVIGNVHGMNRVYNEFSNYCNRIRNFVSDVMNLKF